MTLIITGVFSPPLLSETLKAAQTSAESSAQAAAEGAAAGAQGAPERTLPERGGAVAAGDGGGRSRRRPGHTDVTAVNQSVLPLRPLPLPRRRPQPALLPAACSLASRADLFCATHKCF